MVVIAAPVLFIHFLLVKMATPSATTSIEGLVQQQLLHQHQPADPADSLLIDSMEACFKAFDKDSDGLMTFTDFGTLCRTLFRNQLGKAYVIEDKTVEDMFNVFDVNQDSYIDFQEFHFCWKYWIKPIVRPVSALIVVDVQNDFIRGSLSLSNCPAQQDGLDVLTPINKMLETVPFDCVFYSLDWHPDNHVSFIENVNLRKTHPSSKVTASEAAVYDTITYEGPLINPVIEQKLWPKHCVQTSWGSELHQDLKVMENGIFIHKGTHPDIESYSAFWDNNKIMQTNLYTIMKQKKITDFYVCGLAYDVCVGATASDSLEHGFRTILVEDACRGISVDNMGTTRKGLADRHALVVSSSEVKDMVQGRDRRAELGYFKATRLRPNKRDNLDSPAGSPMSDIMLL